MQQSLQRVQHLARKVCSDAGVAASITRICFGGNNQRWGGVVNKEDWRDAMKASPNRPRSGSGYRRLRNSRKVASLAQQDCR
jgi:hypothetical protein